MIEVILDIHWSWGWNRARFHTRFPINLSGEQLTNKSVRPHHRPWLLATHSLPVPHTETGALQRTLASSERESSSWALSLYSVLPWSSWQTGCSRIYSGSSWSVISSVKSHIIHTHMTLDLSLRCSVSLQGRLEYRIWYEVRLTCIELHSSRSQLTFQIGHLGPRPCRPGLPVHRRRKVCRAAWSFQFEAEHRASDSLSELVLSLACDRTLHPHLQRVHGRPSSSKCL